MTDDHDHALKLVRDITINFEDAEPLVFEPDNHGYQIEYLGQTYPNGPASLPTLVGVLYDLPVGMPLTLIKVKRHR